MQRRTFLRKHNMSGEGTIEQFEDIIIPELEVLLNLDLLSACKFHRRICLK